MSIKTLIKSISPSWLQEGVAERYMGNYGSALDTLLDKLAQGIRARMPTLADRSALPYIGADRLIPRGLTESDESHAMRLQRAFDDWQLAGGPWMVLRQALGYVLATTPAARTVSDTYTSAGGLVRSIWNSYATGADTTAPPLRTVGTNWDWDSQSPTDGSWGWWRHWFIIEAIAPNDWCKPGPLWGGGYFTWGEPTISWGLDVSSSVVDGLRGLLSLWGSEHAWLKMIIVSFDASLFDPAQPAGGSVNPDGNFGRWSKVVNGQYVRARFSNARYCHGVD